MKKMTTGKKLYIVTGADGHLGNTIVRMLQTLPDPFVRGLLLPGATPPCRQIDRIQYVWEISEMLLRWNRCLKILRGWKYM